MPLTTSIPRQSGRADRRWWVLALLVMAQFVVILDAAIVNVALPSIQTHLHFSTPNLQYVVTAYAITFGGLLLLGGRLSDRLGRRRLFMAGVALFTVTSLLNGISTSQGELIALRALQGIGAALLTPAALSLLVTTFTEARERNLALGIWAAAAGSGGAAGLLLGGALTPRFRGGGSSSSTFRSGWPPRCSAPFCCARAGPRARRARSTSPAPGRSPAG
jgi:MFS family permease